MHAKTDPRVVGGTYHNGYWHLTYQVLAVEDIGGTRWYTERDASGRIRRHCTAWDAHADREVGQPCRMPRCDWNSR